MPRAPMRRRGAGVALAAIAWIVAGCRTASLTSPPVAQTLLIDDFSNVDAYTPAGVNPYAADAAEPLWWHRAGAPEASDPAQVALHTNNLGELVEWQADDPAAEAPSVSDGGGELTITWTAPSTWTTQLAAPDRGQALPPDGVLVFRVKGRNGGEPVGVQLVTTAGASAARPLSRYVAIRPHVEGILGAGDWQTCIIPLRDFGTPTDAVVAVRLHLEAPGSSATLFLDDLMVVRDVRVPPPAGHAKPIGTGRVQIRDRQLVVDGKPFVIRGVGYSPTPIGQTPEFGLFQPFTPATVQRDLPRMPPVGINAVRTWGRFDEERATDSDGTLRWRQGNRALLDGARASGVRVIAGFWVPYTISFANAWAVDQLADEFRDYVTRYRDDPEILMWVIGNENNLHNGYDWRWYAFADRLARIAYEVEGRAWRPVAIVEAASTRFGDEEDLGVGDAHIPHVDVIGVNLYLGRNWAAIDGFLQDLRERTAKPLWVAEYGVDAWHTHDRLHPSDGHEDPAEQADYDVKAWLGMFRHRPEGWIGATVMEYSDEWWKDHTVPHAEYADHLHLHDYSGWDDSLDEPDALPDQYKNEEWWGLVAVARAEDEGSTDRVTPRPAFFDLYAPTIGGQVLDGLHQPRAGVAVRLIRADQTPMASATTDARGLFAFPRLAPGTYTVTIDPTGPSSPELTLTADDPTQVVELVLSP